MKKPSRRSFLFSIFAAVTGVLGFQIGQENPDPISPDSPTVSRSDEAPLIGIGSLVSDDYIRAVRDAGGIPLVLPNTDGSTAQIQSYLDSLDGLLLPGGADIPPSAYGEEAHETVRILESSSRLSRILGTSQLEVNSLHHQAVGKLGDGLRIVARCPDGVVEATETTDPNRFLIGVQWHPEKLAAGDERQAKLLKAFIEAAKELKAKRALSN